MRSADRVAGAVVTVSGPIRQDVLATWLVDLGPAVEVTRQGSAVVVRGLGLDLHLDTSDARGVDPAWWAASVLRRAVRTVPDVGECGSPGLADVLRDGHWTHPRAGRRFTRTAGVMLVKPGMRVSPRALEDIGSRLAECGYRVERARAVSAADIARDDLAVQHHGAHSELANRGRMSPLERIAFLTTYDKPAFTDRFGTTPDLLDVFPAQVVIDKLGVPAETLSRWSMRDTARHGLNSGAVDGPNGIGDCLFVNVFQDPGYHGGQPFAVLNPHMPGVLAEFEAGNGAIALQITEVSAEALPWSRMRREFCGVTDPESALPGSVRGDAHAGLLDLSGVDGKPVRRINNGVHLSNGAVEALRDGWTWLGSRPDHTEAGRLLSAAGVSPWDTITKPFIAFGQTRRVAQEVTDGLEAGPAATLLAAGRLIAHADDLDDWDLVRLVDTAWRDTAELRHVPVTAILVVRSQDGTGTLVVVDDERAGRFRKIPPAVHCSVEEAPRVLSRLGGEAGVVLPLWDPERLFARFSA